MVAVQKVFTMHQVYCHTSARRLGSTPPDGVSETVSGKMHIGMNVNALEVA